MRKVIYECQCDRCLRIWNVESMVEFIESLKIREVNGRKYDLCLDCAKDYDDFLLECNNRYMNGDSDV